MRSKTAFREGTYVTAAIVDRTLVEVLAACGSRVRPASRAVGAHERSSGGVLADSQGLHIAATI